MLREILVAFFDFDLTFFLKCRNGVLRFFPRFLDAKIIAVENLTTCIFRKKTNTGVVLHSGIIPKHWKLGLNMADMFRAKMCNRQFHFLNFKLIILGTFFEKRVHC